MLEHVDRGKQQSMGWSAPIVLLDARPKQSAVSPPRPPPTSRKEVSLGPTEVGSLCVCVLLLAETAGTSKDNRFLRGPLTLSPVVWLLRDVKFKGTAFYRALVTELLVVSQQR